MRRIRCGVRPNKSNQDGFVIQCVLGVKFTDSIPELADLGRDDDAVLAVGPIKSPLVRLRIVGAEGQAFDVAGSRAIGFELLDLGAAVPNFTGNGSAVKFDPRG